MLLWRLFIFLHLLINFHNVSIAFVYLLSWMLVLEGGLLGGGLFVVCGASHSSDLSNTQRDRFCLLKGCFKICDTLCLIKANLLVELHSDLCAANDHVSMQIYALQCCSASNEWIICPLKST